VGLRPDGHCGGGETNRSLVEAIALYRASGYVPAFNHEPHAHLWFEKRL
jgi:hypothetical protein